MKFAWDMDETLFSAISSEAPSKKHYSSNTDMFHGFKTAGKPQEEFPFKKLGRRFK